MRILLLHDSPLDAGPSGLQARALMQSLTAAEHSVRSLFADTQSKSDDANLHRVTFGDESSDLPFEIPRLNVGDPSASLYSRLTDEQVAAYRSVFRQHLDNEVTQFDPHIIHAQHLWVLGELALESGVPYVVSAYAEDFVAYNADPRYQPLADQAAENASRIFITDPALRTTILGRYPHIARYRICDFSAADVQADPTPLVATYQHVLIERMGRLPDDSIKAIE